MPIYFQIHNSTYPIMIESIGNKWPQVAINRAQGYPYYHWLQTESGSGEVWLDNQKIVLQKGEGIMIAPFVPHSYFPTKKWTTQFVTFQAEADLNLFTLSQIKTFACAKDSDYFSYSGWIEETITNHLENKTDDLLLSSQCYHFLLNLNQQKNKKNEDNHPLYQQYVIPTLAEIDTSYAHDLSINELAEKLYISSQYLNRLFVRFLNQSPYQYLTMIRLNHAKQQLISTPESDIQTIANQVGFNSASQFTQLFKQKINLTPKQFRELFFANQKNSSNL